MHQSVHEASQWMIFLERLYNPGSLFFQALVTTMVVAILAQLLGTLLGLLTALARLSKYAILRLPAYVYVVVIRGTPVIVQIFFVYYGANLFFGFTVFPATISLGVVSINGAIVAGIVALGINEGGYIGEIIRAGIQSVSAGQVKAASSLGMRPSLAMRRVILPQAVRVIIPPFGNEFNNTMKTTSLLYLIGVYEMFADAQVHYSTTFLPAAYFGAVAMWYLVLTTAWAVCQTALERRLAIPTNEPIESTRLVTRLLQRLATAPGSA
jgi:polar amino acid transport system permease protein